MADPTQLLHKAIIAALETAPAVASGRIYGRVQPNATFPYVSLGPIDTVGDDNSCFDSSECNVQVNVWSNHKDMREVEEIAGLVRTRLKTEPTLTGFNVPVAEYVTTRYLDDPQQELRRAALEFRYLIDHSYS
jgi:hypothetical protein